LKQALDKSHNKGVKAFAETMVRDHEAVNKQALALLDKLKVKPEDNDTSKSLANAASKKHEELYQLDGTAFDKAYAANEVTYHQTVNAALEKTLIPSAQNAELKSLLQTGLKLFKEHEKHAEKLVSELQ
jgi:putative membrane protein